MQLGFHTYSLYHHGIAEAIGADVAKLGMSLSRPRPVAASKFHPEVMVQLENVVAKLKQAAPLAQVANVNIGVENHTDAFSEEVIDRLKWMAEELAPLLREALLEHGEMDMKSMISQALQMGDEGHNRNRAVNHLGSIN